MEGGGKRHFFMCPGCNITHTFVTDREQHPVWTYNGDPEKPTFNPSLLCKHTITCHLFLHDGKLQFCGDSEHELKNQTVDLPDVPKWLEEA